MRKLTFILLAGLFLAMVPAELEAQTAKILKVENVSLSILKTNPPQLEIVADGKVTSSGWTVPTLVPYVYVKPPADGIYEFDFVAHRPGGIVTPALEDIQATHRWKNFPQELKGVRIYASQNSISESLGKDDSFAMQTVYLHTPLEKAHRIVLTGKFDPKGDGSGKLQLDRNSCTLNKFGDSESCTEAYYAPFDVKLKAIKLKDPLGQKRTVYEIIPDKPNTLSDRLYLVTAGTSQAAYRLVSENRRGVQRVVPLDQLSSQPLSKSNGKTAPKPKSTDKK